MSTPSDRRLGQRLAVVLLGAVVAVAMIVLGLWQMQVFEDQGSRDAAHRAAAAPVALEPLIPRDGSVGDAYGRNVTVHGRYRADETVVVADPGPRDRVVTALVLDDGRAVPVVRGTVADGSAPPPAPTDPVQVTGVFLPSEAAPETPAPDGALGTLRLPTLQQRWAEQLSPGFITQATAGAQHDGLQPAPVALPNQDGRFRNFGYALQWWVFATFAVVMTVIWERNLRRRPRAVEKVHAQVNDTTPAPGSTESVTTPASAAAYAADPQPNEPADRPE